MIPSDRQDLIYRLGFAHVKNMTVSMAAKFVAAEIGPREYFERDASALAQATGGRPETFDSAKRAALLSQSQQEADFMDQRGIYPLFWDTPDYPARLKECDDAPAVLYCRGEARPRARHVMAVVGTRHCTAYGKTATERLIADLAARVDDLVVVSGLAYGVDIAAHRAALENGIPTIAVVAHGLNTLYPADHRNDARRIIQSGGALMTEYRSCDALHRGNFLARNRIVAGMADVTVVMESDAKGGAMVTARLAAEYNREVMAAPGRTTDVYSRGCNRLIATNAAHLLTDASSLIEACGWAQKTPEGQQQELMLEISPLQRKILDFLVAHPEATVNEMTAQLALPYATLSSELFEMEMADLVQSLPGGRYSPC